MSVPNFTDAYGQPITAGDVVFVQTGKFYSACIAVMGNVVKRKNYNVEFHVLEPKKTSLRLDKVQYADTTFQCVIKATDLFGPGTQFYKLLQPKIDELKGSDFYSEYHKGFQRPFFDKWIRSLNKIELTNRWYGSTNAEFTANFNTGHNEEKYRTRISFKKGGHYSVSIGKNWWNHEACISDAGFNNKNHDFGPDGVPVFREQEFLDWVEATKKHVETL